MSSKTTLSLVIRVKFVVVQYFYDPEGRQYKTKSQVLCAWEESGLVLLN